MTEPQQPLRTYLLPFLDYCEIEKGLAGNTQRNYRQYLRVLFAWLDKTRQSGLQPRDLTAKHVWDYRLYLARRYKTPRGGYLTKKSQNLYLMALRAFLRYLAERDIETFPSTKVMLAKRNPARDPAPDREIRPPGRAIEEGDTPHDAAYLRHRPSVPWRRSAQRPGAFGPQERGDHPDLHPRHE